MTVIAWDGVRLAADRQANLGNVPYVATSKIFKRNNLLLGYSGDADAGEEIMDWYFKGADTDLFPIHQRGDSARVSMLIIPESGDLLVYERTPFPVKFQRHQFFALGSGMQGALVAMHLGKSAEKAVEIVSMFDIYCGQGVEVLKFDN